MVQLDQNQPDPVLGSAGNSGSGSRFWSWLVDVGRGPSGAARLAWFRLAQFLSCPHFSDLDPEAADFHPHRIQPEPEPDIRSG